VSDFPCSIVVQVSSLPSGPQARKGREAKVTCDDELSATNSKAKETPMQQNSTQLVNKPTFRSKSRAAAIALLLAAGILIGPAHLRADPDTSTPKAAAVAFAKAVESGDMKLAHTLAIGSDTSFKVFDNLSDMVQAAKRLQDVVKAKFGESLELPNNLLTPMSSDFASDNEKIDGDTATLVKKDGTAFSHPPTLKKTSAGWKMDLSKGDSDDHMAKMATLIEQTTKAIDAIAQKVKDGKFATVADVTAELQHDMRGQ
jgi:hypothetical protein